MDRDRPSPPWLARNFLGYLAALVLVAAAGGLAFVVDGLGQGANLAMLFLASVLVAALAFGLGPALVAAAVAVLSYNFFFLTPRYSLVIGRPTDVLTFAVFIATAAVTGWLAGRVRDQAREAARRAQVVAALLAASQRLSAAASREQAAQVLAEQVAEAAGSPAVVLLPDQRGLTPVAGAPGAPALPPTALAAARQAWSGGEETGAGTVRLPEGAWRFRPLRGLQGMAGVAGFADTAAPRTVEDAELIAALIDQGAVALERAELATVHADVLASRQSDRLRGALLNSISHDLRTPLATILGSATTLIGYDASLAPPVRRDLLESIREEAERLNRYVGQLLDMTRLEGGALAPRLDWVDVREVLDAALARTSRRLTGRPVNRDAPANLSLVKADALLLEQALVNILENAASHTPDGTPIEAAAYEDRSHVVLAIEDEGPGFRPQDMPRLFEKFRRIQEASDRAPGGAGLGLAIAKGFVEAMGGRIAAASPVREGRGARFLISLPKQVATHEYLL